MPHFATTHWSVILDGQRDPAHARAALVEICRDYRLPVLSYLRTHGYRQADAEDLTQEFFARLVEQRWDGRADPSLGRFRAFLLTALRRFLSNELARDRAGRRGGTLQRVALDEVELSTPHAQSPEQAFNHAWMMTVVEHAAQRLEHEACRVGRQALYRRLAEYLVEPPDPAEYRGVADELGLKPNTVAVHVHRLRRRLRELIREELAETVSDTDALDAELQALREIAGTDVLH